jgi:hypothetical protein
VTEEMVVYEQLSLDDLAAEIHRELEAADEKYRTAVGHAVRTGDLLIEAKSRLGHGKWMPWLEANFEFTPQLAGNYMRLARHADQIESALSISAALKQISAASGGGGGDGPDEEAPVWSEEQERLRGLLEEGLTVVVNLRTHDALIEWAQERDLFVRVDRHSPWGNPFLLEDDGDRETVVARYRDHYLPHKPSLLERIAELEGKALGCWCAPDLCHADVLADFFEG